MRKLSMIILTMLLMGFSSPSHAQQVKYDDMLNTTTYMIPLSDGDYRIKFFGSGKTPSCVDSARIEYRHSLLGEHVTFDYLSTVTNVKVLIKADSTLMTLDGTGRVTQDMLGKYFTWTFHPSLADISVLMSTSEVILRFVDDIPYKKTVKQTYKTTMLEKWSKLVPACLP